MDAMPTVEHICGDEDRQGREKGARGAHARREAFRSPNHDPRRRKDGPRTCQGPYLCFALSI